MITRYWARPHLLAILILAAPALARAQTPTTNLPPGSSVEMSFPIFFANSPPAYRISHVNPASNQIRISPAVKPLSAFPPAEGYHVLLLRSAPESAAHSHAIRIQITEIAADGSLLASVGPAAIPLLKPADVDLIRPFQGLVDPYSQPGSQPTRLLPAATAQLRALPDAIPLGGDKPRPGIDPVDAARTAAKLTQSTNNLKQIMLALHNYESANGHFPPAIVYGPDGKPWHSWRVLILPFIEQIALYNQYDFTQPWDSPGNLKLADTIIKVYQDPALAEPGKAYTSYAAIVGKNAIFQTQGSRITDPANPMKQISQGAVTRITDITDGTSNTICIVPIDPARKIPWTKPEDLNIDQATPAIGKPGAITAPYRSADGKTPITPVAFTDGAVRTLKSSIPQELLQALCTRNGGEVINADHLGDSPAPARIAMKILKFFKKSGGSYAAVIE